MGKDKLPKYVILAPACSGALPPPPPVRHHQRHRHRSSNDGCCLCCYCCCYCFFILLIVSTVLASIAYLNPKRPSYSIDHLSITSFNISPDLTINTNFSISVRAENPNERIGITYGQTSSIVLAYRDANLCSGKWPGFYHGYHNTTVVNVVMDGKCKFDNGMQATLNSDRQSGRIPLDVSIKVPVQLRVVGRDIKPVTVSVRCKLVVDNLEPDKKTGIKMANCNVDW